MCRNAQPQVEPERRECDTVMESLVKPGVRRCKISYSSDGGGGADVERRDAAAQRQRDELVAGRRDARAQARALGAQHEHDAAARSRAASYGTRPRRRGAVAPAARAPWRRARKSARLRTRAIAQVLDRAGRRLADRRRDLGRAALRQDDAGRARALGGAADRAEVLRVLDLVERDQQRVGPRRAARRRRRTGSGRPRRRCPGAPCEPQRARDRLGGGASARRATPRRQPRLPRAARSVAQTRRDRPRARPRSASRTGCGRRRSPARARSSGRRRRRAPPSRARHLVAQAVGLGEVPRGARALARRSASARDASGRRAAVARRAGSRARARSSISRRSRGRPTAAPRAVGLADPLEQRGQRLAAC